MKSFASSSFILSPKYFSSNLSKSLPPLILLLSTSSSFFIVLILFFKFSVTEFSCGFKLLIKFCFNLSFFSFVNNFFFKDNSKCLKSRSFNLSLFKNCVTSSDINFVLLSEPYFIIYFSVNVEANLERLCIFNFVLRVVLIGGRIFSAADLNLFVEFDVLRNDASILYF